MMFVQDISKIMTPIASLLYLLTILSNHLTYAQQQQQRLSTSSTTRPYLPIKLRAGIILSNGSDLPYDYTVVAPALQAAYEKSRTDYNIIYAPILSLYQSNKKGCYIAGAMGATFLALNQSIDVIIGPACTDDMMASLELQTFYLMPSITGAGDLTDSTAKFPYVTRCSYNTYTQWIFVVRLCLKFDWTNVAVIYDLANNAKSVNARSLMKNLRDNNIRPYDMSFSSHTIKRDNVTGIDLLLKNASLHARVIVLLMDGLLVRQFMMAASELGQTNGDFVYITLDLFQDDVLGNNGWRQGNKQLDQIAFKAYKSLFVLSLRDTREEPRYQDFVARVQNIAYTGDIRLTLNYYTASFYDSILLYAAGIREILNEGHSIKSDNVMEVSQKFWNRTFPGATGLVYINPLGDRNDDHALHALQPDGSFDVIAEFYGYKDIIIPGYLFDQLHPFQWNNPTNTPPKNEPICGYLRDDPACDKTYHNLTIGFGTAAAILLICIILSIFLRNLTQRQRELRQLDLLATWHDIRDASYVEPPKRLMRTHPPPVVSKSLPLDSMPSNDVYARAYHLILDPHTLAEEYYQLSMHTIAAKFRGVGVMVRVCQPEQVPVSRAVLKEVKLVRAINHENLVSLRGFCLGPDRAAVLYDYCARGNLYDLVSISEFHLEEIFKYSLIRDIIQGLTALHSSNVKVHGRLTSRCCFVDAHFTCKIADSGLPSFFKRTRPFELTEEFCSSLLWTAPEHLEDPFSGGSQEGDVYSLSMIMCEMMMREAPFSSRGLPSSVVLAKIHRRKAYSTMRPRIEISKATPEMIILIKQCWAQNPMERPRMAQVRRTLLQISGGNLATSGSLVERLIQQTEDYTTDLENIVEEKSLQVLGEMRKSERLLYEILPRSVADQLTRGEKVLPESYDSVTVQYNDIVEFTTLSSGSTPTEVVNLLNDLFTVFDSCIQRFDTHKIETIGDCYVVASGVPTRNGDQHATEVCRLSLMLLEEIKVFKIRHRPNEQLQLRLGIHSGPCAAGVVGLVMPRYCLFGETIRIANKMESTSEAMRIQISDTTKDLLQSYKFETEPRDNVVEITDKRSITTSWLLRQMDQSTSHTVSARSVKS